MKMRCPDHGNCFLESKSNDKALKDMGQRGAVRMGSQKNHLKGQANELDAEGLLQVKEWCSAQADASKDCVGTWPGEEIHASSQISRVPSKVSVKRRSYP